MTQFLFESTEWLVVLAVVLLLAFFAFEWIRLIREERKAREQETQAALRKEYQNGSKQDA